MKSLLKNSQLQSCHSQPPLDSSQAQLGNSQPQLGINHLQSSNRQPVFDSSQHHQNDNQNQLYASRSESSSQSDGGMYTWKCNEEDLLVKSQYETSVLDSSKSSIVNQDMVKAEMSGDLPIPNGSKEKARKPKEIQSRIKRKSTEIIELMERQNTELYDRMEQYHQAKISRMDRFLDLYEKDINSKASAGYMCILL